jgi:hypothetical protein
MSETAVDFDPKAIPAEIRRWSWGAFLLNWIWGIGNNTFIALLTLIPFVGFIMLFVLGAKGNAWAWRNGRWDSVEHFRRVQRKWAIWGFVVWIGTLVLFGGLIGGVFYALKHSVAYEMAVTRLQSNPIATTILGSPIATGMPFGAISIGGGGGRAALSFSATGPKAKGTVFVEAMKKDGVWSIVKLMLKPQGSENAIDLVNTTRRNTT